MTNVTNPSPKLRFQAEKALVEAHKKLIENDALQTSMDFALLQMQAMITQEDLGGNAAAAAHYRMMGAHEFVKIFRELPEQYTPPVIKTKGNLDHNV